MLANLYSKIIATSTEVSDWNYLMNELAMNHDFEQKEDSAV